MSAEVAVGQTSNGDETVNEQASLKRRGARNIGDITAGCFVVARAPLHSCNVYIACERSIDSIIDFPQARVY